MKWPDLRLPPINLWNAPRLARKEITVTDLENALARIAELERERDALESEIKGKIAQNLQLMRDRDDAFEREKALAVKLPLDPTHDMIEQGAQALVQWACDGLVWPDSWSVLDVQSARRDAKKAYRAMVREHIKGEP